MVKIYGLIHKLSGRTYVGCAKYNIPKRMREHRFLLNAGKHASKSLQNDWDTYGESGFEIVVFEQLPDGCDVITKRSAELHWMKVRSEGLYNENLTSFRPTEEARKKGVAIRAKNLLGSKQSEETKRKRSIAQLGIPKNHGAKISATKQRNKLAKLTRVD